MDEFDILLSTVRTDFKNADEAIAEAKDEDRLFKLLRRHKLGSHVLFFGKDGLRATMRERLEAEYSGALTQFEKTYRLVSWLERVTADAGLRFLVVKGAGLNHCIYGAEKIRSFGDLDILVRPSDVAAFHRVFNENGFFQKTGPTSSAAAANNYGRAFLAFHAKNAGKTYGASPFPIKEHTGKPQYIAYCRTDELNIEMHDSLYFLSASAIESMWENTVRIAYEDGSFPAPGAEHNLLLLLTNTYENSESFFSNTYDFGAVLRDYVDLRFFFEKYRNILDWAKVERLTDNFGIRSIAETVMGNLLLVYGRDVTFGCLPSVKAVRSEWGLGILERMRDVDLCRKTAIAAMRKRWLAQGSLSVLRVPAAKDDRSATLDGFRRCAAREDVFFCIEYRPEAFLLSWAIPPSLQRNCDFLVYRFGFFPLTDNFDYTSYELDFCARGGVYAAYGHSTKHHRFLGMIRKETGFAMPVTRFMCGRTLVIQTSLPFHELGTAGIPENESFCVSAEIYKEHYGEIYHRLGAWRTEAEMSLIETK